MPRTRRVEEQLREAFPERPRRDIDAWTLGVFEHFGRSLAELILLSGRHRTALIESVETDGFEHFIEAEKASLSGGVLVVTAHYGNWELAGVSIARRGIPISAIFRGLDNPVLDEALLKMRRDDAFAPVDYEQIRVGRAGLGLVRSLKAGRKAFVLLDQNARREEGVFVSFFGRPACVRTGAVRVAMRLGIPILPAFIRRNPSGQGHRITIHPALPLERDSGEADGGSLNRHLADLTAFIEAEIRKDPTQWIWTHRRWRTEPREIEAEAKSTGGVVNDLANARSAERSNCAGSSSAAS